MYYLLIIIVVIIFQWSERNIICFFLGDRIILGKEIHQSLVCGFKVGEIIILYCSKEHIYIIHLHIYY